MVLVLPYPKKTDYLEYFGNLAQSCHRKKKNIVHEVQSRGKKTQPLEKAVTVQSPLKCLKSSAIKLGIQADYLTLCTLHYDLSYKLYDDLFLTGSLSDERLRLTAERARRSNQYVGPKTRDIMALWGSK